MAAKKFCSLVVAGALSAFIFAFRIHVGFNPISL